MELGGEICSNVKVNPLPHRHHPLTLGVGELNEIS